MLTLLPECLYRVVLCEWLEAETVRHLDWAMCGCEGQETFQQVLVDFVISVVRIHNKPILRWLLLRKVRCRDVVAFNDPNKEYDDLLTEYFSFGGGGFCSVHAKGYNFPKTIMRAILSPCTALINFSCDHISIAQMARLLAYNSRTLQTVEINILYHAPEDPITHFDVIPRLDSLTTLCLPVQRSSCAALARELIAKSRKVEKLCLNLVNDDFQFAIPSACPRLRSLKVRHHRPMRALSASITTHCARVVNLDLYGCFRLKDKDVRTFAVHLPSLCTLDLRHCKYLTDRSLQHLGDHRVNTLQLLLLGSNEFITRAQMNLLIQQCKRCNTDLQLRCIQSFYYEDRTGSVPPALCDDETTVALALSDLDDEYVPNIVMHNYVEVVCVGKLNFQLTKEGMGELCAKLPRLSTVVVYGRSTYHTDKVAPHFPHLTFTTCPSMAEHDLVNLPM